jgi:hypothetical protein
VFGRLTLPVLGLVAPDDGLLIEGERLVGARDGADCAAPPPPRPPPPLGPRPKASAPRRAVTVVKQIKTKEDRFICIVSKFVVSIRIEPDQSER